MMTLNRFSAKVDGSIPVHALLYNDEDLLASQHGVGIYDGQLKSNLHQNGTIHVTTHRLFYIDVPNPSTHSFLLDLSYVSQTDYYAGLFKSSPKVTLYLSPSPALSGLAFHHPEQSDPAEAAFQSWECQVCAYRNPPGLSPAAARICSLCGVPRASVPAVTSIHLSSSLPTSSSDSTLLSASPAATSQTDDNLIPCPACTFLNHPSLLSCEICSTKLPPSQHQRRQLKSAPSSRTESPVPDEDDFDQDSKPHRLIKVSFRKGGDKPFYAVLKRSLKGKAWEGKGLGPSTGGFAKHSDTNLGSNENSFTKSGISGILRTVETSSQGRESNLKDALQDLEALMVKAKDMVRLAAELNEKLTASSSATSSSTSAPYLSSPAANTNVSSPISSAPSSSTTLVPSSTEPEEATFIRSSLSQLGLQMANTPVTLDMMKDERRWYEELARELASVLQGDQRFGSSKSSVSSYGGREGAGNGMMKKRNIIALDEAWGGWNRARGVALIPPTTFLQVIPLLPSYTSPTIHTRTFSSGLVVLHTPPYTHTSFSSRLVTDLKERGPKTGMEIAEQEGKGGEGVTVGLIKEMIDAVEKDGTICRDDVKNKIIGAGSFSSGGVEVEVMWWPNIFVGYNWDGQM